MFLQLEVDVMNADSEEMYFEVRGKHMPFGRLEFCLITGLLFGLTPSLPVISEGSFVRRLWPDHDLGNLKMKTVVQTMGSGMQELSDEDVVRVCLVVMVEVMFMGRELSQVVSDTVLRAVDDLVTFDSYSWGSHIWSHTYNSLHNAIAIHNLQKNKNINKSTLNGFAHALKVWILEMFPVCCHHFTRRTDRPIRGTRWDRHVVLNKAACVAIFNSLSDSAGWGHTSAGYGYMQASTGGFAIFSTTSLSQDFRMPEADCYRPQMMTSRNVLGPPYVTPPAHLDQGTSVLSIMMEDFFGPFIPFSMGSAVDTTQARLSSPMGSDIFESHFEDDALMLDQAKVEVHEAELITLGRGRRDVVAGPNLRSPYIQQPSTTPVPSRKTKPRVKTKAHRRLGQNDPRLLLSTCEMGGDGHQLF